MAHPPTAGRRESWLSNVWASLLTQVFCVSRICSHRCDPRDTVTDAGRRASLPPGRGAQPGSGPPHLLTPAASLQFPGGHFQKTPGADVVTFHPYLLSEPRELWFPRVRCRLQCGVHGCKGAVSQAESRSREKLRGVGACGPASGRRGPLYGQHGPRSWGRMLALATLPLPSAWLLCSEGSESHRHLSATENGLPRARHLRLFIQVKASAAACCMGEV